MLYFFVLAVVTVKLRLRKQMFLVFSLLFVVCCPLTIVYLKRYFVENAGANVSSINVLL